MQPIRRLADLEQSLDSLTKRNKILTKANQKGKMILGFTSVLAFLVIIMTSIYALQKFREAQEAQTGTKLEQQSNSIIRQFSKNKLSDFLIKKTIFKC